MSAVDVFTAAAILIGLTAVAAASRWLFRTGPTVTDLREHGADLEPLVPAAADNHEGTDAEALWTCRRAWTTGTTTNRNTRKEGQQ